MTRVPSISSQQLAALAALPLPKQPLLLDVRKAEEYTVSHLPSALWAETENDQRALIDHANAGRPVVLYCSVGWRSANAARKLIHAGYQQIFDLTGSIFQWAHQRRPLTDGVGPVVVVHPFDRVWGQLLEKKYWPISWL